MTVKTVTDRQTDRFRLSGTGIVECLEIIDVGCNLKQFEGLT